MIVGVAHPTLAESETEDYTGETHYGALTVPQGETYTLDNQELRTESEDDQNQADIEVYGTLEMTNSVLEAGNDSDDLPNNSNIILDGATVTMKDSDLEANGDINIKDGTKLTSTSSNNMHGSNNYGVWADKNITIENSNINLTRSYVAANGDISITGGEHTLDDSDIRSDNGTISIEGGKYTLDDSDILSDNGSDSGSDSGTISIKNSDMDLISGSIDATKSVSLDGGKYTLDASFISSEEDSVVIKGGNYTLKNLSEISSEVGDVSFENSTVNADYSDIYANKNLSVKGGDFTLSNQMDLIAENGTITLAPNTLTSSENSKIMAKGEVIFDGGTYNVSDTKVVSKTDNITFNSGTINVAEGSTLGMYGGNDDDASSVITKSESVFNLSGNLNLGKTGDTLGLIDGNGTINILNSKTNIRGNVNLTEGGVMNIGTNKATVEGDVVFNSGSTVKMTVNSKDEFGSLTANSVAGKEGSSLALNISNAIKDTITVQLFDADVDDNFTREISNNRYNVTSEDGKNYVIEYTASASDIVSEVAGTANNAQTAEAWDTIANDPKVPQKAQEVAKHLNDLSQNDAKGYKDALTALAPDSAPSVTQTSQTNAQQVFGAVGGRFGGGNAGGMGGGPRGGMSSGDVIGQRGAVWVQGLYNKAKLDDTASSKGFSSKSYGTAMGLETQYTDDVKLGIGYAYSKTSIDGFMRDTDVTTHTAILYGEYRPNNWYINGVASYGWSDYSEKKNVSGINVSADYDAESLGLQAMTGYDLNMKPVIVTPEVGLRYVRVDQDDYTDTAGQSVSTDASSILTGVVGLKASTTIPYCRHIMIRPEAHVAATYDIANDDVNSVVTLANGSSYAVSGDSLDRFGIEAGASVTADINDEIEISLGYEGKFRSDYQDHSGLINLKYNF